MLFRNPEVQTIAAKFAASFLSKKTGAEVFIEKLNIGLRGNLSFTNLEVIDFREKQMISVKKLRLNPGRISLKNKEANIRSLSLEGVTFAIRQYRGDESDNLGHLLKHFRSQAADTLQTIDTANGWKILCKNLKLRNAHFIYENQDLKISSPAIDFDDIELLDLDILASNIEIGGDTIKADFGVITFIEKSGFELQEFSAKIKFSPTGLSAHQLLIKTNNSNLDLDLKFEYANLSAFAEFIDEVNFNGHFRESELQMSDIGYFAETMFSMSDLIKLKGDVSGRVNNIRGKNLDIEYGDVTKFLGSWQMSGLPNITETFVHANIQSLKTSAADVRSFALPANAAGIPIPELLQKVGVVNITGKFTGFYNDFVSKADFKSPLGNLSTDILLKTSKKTKLLTYRGKLKATNLDIGTLFSAKEQLGKTSFVLEVDGRGIMLDSLDITAKGMVQSLQFNNYNYENISLDGNFNNRIFTGHTEIKDENLDFEFNGLIHFDGAKPRFDFNSTVHHADLFKLKISKRDSVSVLATKMNFDFRATGIDDVRGIIVFDSTQYTEHKNTYFLNKLLLSSDQATDGLKSLRMRSDFIDADFEGYYTLSDIIPSIKNYLQNYSPIVAQKLSEKPAGHQNQYIDISINLKETRDISKLFFPELTLAPEASILGVVNFPEKKVQIEGNADWINYSAIKMYDWKLLTNSNSEQFGLSIDVDKIYFGDIRQSDSLPMGIDSLQIHTTLNNDSIAFGITWNDLNNINQNTGDIKGYLEMGRNNSYSAGFYEVNVLIDSAAWTVNPRHKIISNPDGLFFEDIKFESDTSLFSISGGISENPSDSLWMAFEKLNISHLDQLIQGGQVDVNGILDGSITLTNLLVQPNFLADLSLDDLYFNGENLGVLNLKTTWDNTYSRLGVDLDISKQGEIGIDNTLKINGDYFPSGVETNFDLEVNISMLSTHVFNPFFEEFFELDKSSLASGNVHFTGNYAKPVATGKIDLIRTQFLIKYLNTLYTAAGSIDVGENFFNVNNLELYDSRLKSAICTGRINHTYFKNFNLDIHIAQENFSTLNTTSRDNELFYGTAIASGKVDIVGPLDDILMEIKVKTDEGTRIIVPISSSLNVSENDFIIFLNTADSLKSKESTYDVNLKGFTMNMELNVTPDANIEIFLPYNMGNIKGNGSGEIGMGIYPNGHFTMNGDYVISDGTFLFNFENILGREFKINEGSKISWTGDPYDASVDISATYHLKTTLAGLRLQTDSSSIRNTRVEVNCNINLRNALFNPDITFSIDFANVAEDTKQIIYAALDTTDQSAMSQQILSLLVIGSFSYTSAGPNIGATGFKLLSNQLSEWLSRISKDFDIGINYQPGTELTEEELEVALRTQLFNDRLSIDGNFGVRGSPEEQNTSNVVGDINVEYKITNDGRIRVKAFNRANDISFLEDNAPYTQGVGIFYRKEFENLRDLFKKKGGKKNKSKEEKRNDKATRKKEKAKGKEDK